MNAVSSALYVLFWPTLRLAFALALWWSAVVIGIHVARTVGVAGAPACSAGHGGERVFGTAVEVVLDALVKQLGPPRPEPLSWAPEVSAARRAIAEHAAGGLALWGMRAARGLR